MNDKIILVALMGKSGSGKDTLLKTLPPEWNRPIKFTTRPMREGESNGNPYYFITLDEYIEFYKNNSVAISIYNQWYYGFSLGSFSREKINITCLDLQQYDSLKDNSLFYIIPVILEVDGKERLLRQLNREQDPNVDEIVRRYIADELEYKNFDLTEIKTFDNNHDLPVGAVSNYVYGQI